MNKATKRRFMCDLVFQNDEEAWAAEDKLCAAGFEVLISNHPDDFDDDDGRTRYGMCWKDFDAAMGASERILKPAPVAPPARKRPAI